MQQPSVIRARGGWPAAAAWLRATQAILALLASPRLTLAILALLGAGVVATYLGAARGPWLLAA